MFYRLNIEKFLFLVAVLLLYFYSAQGGETPLLAAKTLIFRHPVRLKVLSFWFAYRTKDNFIIAIAILYVDHILTWFSTLFTVANQSISSLLMLPNQIVDDMIIQTDKNASDIDVENIVNRKVSSIIEVNNSALIWCYSFRFRWFLPLKGCFNCFFGMTCPLIFQSYQNADNFYLFSFMFFSKN